MKCPACQETLTMTERQGVEIDYCPTCRGVWLDRGELDKILERAAGEAAREPAPAMPAYPQADPRRRRDWDDDDDHHRYGKRRKSVWHELFD